MRRTSLGIGLVAMFAVGCVTAPRPKGPDCTEAHVARADCKDLKGNCAEIEETLALCLDRWPGEVRAGLGDTEIAQVSRQVTPKVGRCVDRENSRRRDPVVGEVHVAFLVDGEGRVPYAQVMRSDVDAPNVTRCLLDAVLAARLAATGRTTTGQIPYFFHAKN